MDSGRRLLAGAALLAAGISLQLASARYPELVENLYSRRLFAGIRVIGCVAALVPFSVGEVLLVVLAVVAAAMVVHTLRRPVSLRARALFLLSGGILAAGIVYCSFLLVWGLNYARQPFGLSAGLDVRPASVEELRELAGALVEEANQARLAVTEDAAGVMRLGQGTDAALELAPAGFAQAERNEPVLGGGCARPKRLLLSPLVAYLGITGIYSPFTGEPNVNTTVPDPELPFAASHEIAHEHGFAREDEANYLGYLACRLHPDADFRYSGLLAASVYAQNALYRADRPARDHIEKMRSAGVRRDLDALRAWSERHEGRASEAAERVNDAYLKSQGQAGGVQSYGRVVDLLLAERRAASGPRAAR